MYVELHEVAITSSSSGAGTAYTDTPVTGRIHQLAYSTGDGVFSTTGTVAVTGEDTGVSIYSAAIGAASFTKYPRAAVVNATGGAIVYSTADGATVVDHIVVANERIQFAIAATTAAQSGTFRLWVS